MGGAGDHRSSAVLGLLPGQADHRRPSRRRPALLLLFLFVGLGAVGFLDDYIKISKQRSLGLRSKAKLVGQTVIARGLRRARAVAVLEDEPRPDPGRRTHLSFIRDFESFALPDGRGGAADPGDDRRHQQRGEPHRRARRPRHRRLDDGVRRLHAGEHLAEQPVVRARPGPKCYEVRDPLDLAVVAAAHHRRLLRLPVVERLAGQDLHGRHRLARRSAARWPASRS